MAIAAIHLRAMTKSWAWVLRQIRDLVAYARWRSRFVSIGSQDASRSAPSLLARCARTAQQAGADRLRLADTVSVWNPFQNYTAILSPRAAAP
jgi:homocitrate synthase NifV